MSSCECRQTAGPTDRRILTIAFVLNASMFVIGMTAGLLAQSIGLIADSLDMLADASAYALGLLAIGRGIRFKAMTAAFSGSLLLLLGMVVLLDVSRRAWFGSSPESEVMIVIASISLIVNVIVLRLLKRFRDGEVHLRATWIFTRADVIANLGVIISGVLVYLTNSRYPDLIIGFVISLYVIKEAFEILKSSYEAKKLILIEHFWGFLHRTRSNNGEMSPTNCLANGVLAPNKAAAPSAANVAAEK